MLRLKDQSVRRENILAKKSKQENNTKAMMISMKRLQERIYHVENKKEILYVTSKNVMGSDGVRKNAVGNNV